MVKKAAEEISGETMLVEVVVELLTQGLQTGTVDVRQEAAERGAVGHLVAPKERHEGTGERGDAVEEFLERRFMAEGIAEQKSNEIDDIVPTSATAGEVDLVRDCVKDAALGEKANEQGQFSEPRRDRRDILRVDMNVDRSDCAGSHVHLLESYSETI